MTLEIAAWNIKEGLAQAHEAPEIIERIMRMGAEIVVLSDAFSLENDLHGSSAEVLSSSVDALAAEGYTYHGAEYADGWHHDRNIVVLSRLALSSVYPVFLYPRNTLQLTLHDQESELDWNITAAHFHDRGELLREITADHYIRNLDLSRPTVLAGDLNTMDPSSVTARVLRSPLTQMAAKMLRGRQRYNAERFIDMAKGDSYGLLELFLQDADPSHQPTFPARQPVAQLDHIMVSDLIEVENYSVGVRSRASDHLPVCAKLAIK